MNKDYFKHKSKLYDSQTRRVNNVKNIADGILNNIKLSSNDTILDFGSGTGLLSEYISLHVKKIIANDISSSMNETLSQKIAANKFSSQMQIISTNLCEQAFPYTQLDGIISSMTIHHIQDIPTLFRTFFSLLKCGGFIALADLESEDGSFHTEDTGVFHFGFDKKEFLAHAKTAGFVNLNIETVSLAKKPHGEFPVFLLTGEKRSLEA